MVLYRTDVLLPVVVAHETGGIALGIVLVYHPIIVVALHPAKTHGGVLRTGNHIGTGIVLRRILSNLLRGDYLTIVVDGVLPNLIDSILVVLSVCSGDAEV